MITEFKGPTRWLSNFTPCRIILDGLEYPSVEHAYMSAKSDDPNWKEFCSKTISPGDVKRAGRKIKLIHNWELIKFSVMKECLEQKFSQEPFKSNLIATGSQEIQEGNWWNDKIWGVCLKTGEGENNLGKLIMEIRQWKLMN